MIPATATEPESSNFQSVAAQDMSSAWKRVVVATTRRTSVTAACARMSACLCVKGEWRDALIVLDWI